MPVFDPNELARWCGGRWTAPPVQALRRVWQNSREVHPFDLYVALRGTRFDGHDFVSQAFSAGASAALVNREFATRNREPHPLLVVEDPMKALSQLARGYRERLVGRRIGVTGSVGKTTVKDLTAAALSAAGPVAKTLGNWNNEIGLPLSLLAMECDAVFGVFEVGMNHPGELAPLCNLLAPERAILTRVGPVHIEFFKSEQCIAEEKALLLDVLPKEGFAVLAADEPWFDLFRERAPCRVVTVAQSGPADYLASADPRGVRIREPDGTVGVYPLNLPGEPGCANTVRGVAMARESGIAREAIAEALATCTLASMRWQRIQYAGRIWINDAYNSSPLSMEAALKMFTESETALRKWLVLGGMRELGSQTEAAHLQIGRRIAEGTWAGLVVCGELARGYAQGARSAGMPAERIVEADDAAAAAAALVERLSEGDAILLKGSRFEQMEQVLNEWKNRVEISASTAGKRKGSR